MGTSRRRGAGAVGGVRRAAGWEASDEALLAGLGTADPASASVFVRRFQSRVYGVAAAIVGDGPTAADVAQEAFLRAWRHAEAYDPRRGSVATWLLAIARHVAIDRVRMTRARPTEVLDIDSIADRASSEGGPEDAAVVGDDTARVRRSLEDLNDGQRRALLLASIGGYTAQEIADEEGIPLGTAKTRIRAAIGRVRRSLSEEGSDELP